MWLGEPTRGRDLEVTSPRIEGQSMRKAADRAHLLSNVRRATYCGGKPCGDVDWNTRDERTGVNASRVSLIVEHLSKRRGEFIGQAGFREKCREPVVSAAPRQ